jgi:hypothetical protein
MDTECSGDPEFDNATFMQYLKHDDITYKTRPARRDKTTGFVESEHSSIKILARRLVLDSQSSTMCSAMSCTDSLECLGYWELFNLVVSNRCIYAS